MSEVISIGLCWFLAWLFGTAAYYKLRSSSDYLKLMMAYIPGLRGGRMLVWFVAAVELSLAVLLLVPALRAFGMVGSAVLLLSYAGLIAAQLSASDRPMRCGCGGLDSELNVSKVLVLRNIVCAVLAMTGLFVTVSVPNSIATIGLSFYVAIFLIILYLCSDQLVSNAQRMAGEV